MARRRRFTIRTIAAISALLVTIYMLLPLGRVSPRNRLVPANLVIKGDHPIDHLVRSAQHAQQERDASALVQPPPLPEVAKAYRARRGRHPPPGFDRWYALAVTSNASIDEYFFDQIYEDLEPFWGEVPSKLRAFALAWPHVLSIRNNTVIKRSNAEILIWLDIWKTMIGQIPFVPDVDLALSPTDEPHVLVPFVNLTIYMDEAARQKKEHNSVPTAKIRDEMVHYSDIAALIPPELPEFESGFQRVTGATYWNYIIQACRPDDPVFAEPNPYISLYTPPMYSLNYTAGTNEGFVSNFTTSKNVCHNANLRTLHGHLLAPSHEYVFTKLKPVINVAKLGGVSNDIIFPSPVHTLSWGQYQIQQTYKPWMQKINKAIWRGSATGGFHTAGTWWGFHRLRFIHLMNATVISYVEDRFNRFKAMFYEDLPDHDRPGFDWNMQHIPFPSRNLFQLAAQTYGKLGKWSASIVDGACTDYFCAPLYQWGNPLECDYLEPHFGISARVSPEDIDGHKYLPDIDGQSSSGRYRSFLHSFSVPIKASLFVEWADVRLRPWLHFVPMSNEYQEWFGILEYFLGYKAMASGEVSVPDHDAVGQLIGQQGAEWSRQVLRQEDMLLYIYRVILEYARICADDRVHLGWVADL